MTLIVILGLGRLIIWTLQTSPLVDPVFRLHRMLGEMRACDFCLGFWVYAGLAFAWHFNLIAPLPFVPVLTQALSGLGLSFGAHLMALGWHEKWGWDG